EHFASLADTQTHRLQQRLNSNLPTIMDAMGLRPSPWCDSKLAKAKMEAAGTEVTENTTPKDSIAATPEEVEGLASGKFIKVSYKSCLTISCELPFFGNTQVGAGSNVKVRSTAREHALLHLAQPLGRDDTITEAVDCSNCHRFEIKAPDCSRQRCFSCEISEVVICSRSLLPGRFPTVHGSPSHQQHSALEPAQSISLHFEGKSVVRLWLYTSPRHQAQGQMPPPLSRVKLLNFPSLHTADLPKWQVRISI
ncbi:hypothetical protein QJQ45_024075, partial [Haematococcus lacustris]